MSSNDAKLESAAPEWSASPPVLTRDLFRSVLDGVSSGFTAFDLNWHITYLNSAAAQLIGRLGRTPGDLVGRNVWEIFPELVGTRYYAEYQRAMSERVEIEFEEYYPPLDSWFQIRLYPSDEGLLAYSHDVTAEKHAGAMAAERGRITELSAAVGRALTSVLSLREMLQGCAVALVEGLDAAFARIWTLNEQESLLELQASAGMYTHLNGPHGRVSVGQFKIGLIAEERAPHLTNSVVGDARVGDQEWAKREGMVAFAGYPLLVGERLVGVAALFARHPLSDSVLNALEAVADEIAIGIARKQTEDSLRSSQEWLSTTLKSIGDAVITTDPVGLVTSLNRVAETLTGWRQADAIGEPLTRVFHIENERTRQPVDNPVEKVLREGGIVGLANHTVLISKGGSEVAIDDSAAPIQSGEGNLLGVVLVFRDVTQQRRSQRQAEAQHRVSAVLARAEPMERLGSGILEAIGDTLGWTVGLLWLADAQTRKLHVAHTWTAKTEGDADAAFASVSREQVLGVGEGLPGHVFAQHSALWLEDIEALASFPRRDAARAMGIRSGMAVSLRSDAKMIGVLEFFHTRRQPADEGVLRTLEALGQQVGQFIERKSAEEAARFGEAMNAGILAAALDCIISMDDTGCVVEWNPEAERTFGYTREEAIGKDMAELIIPAQFRQLHRDGLARYLATGEGPVLGWRLDITAVRRDRSEFPVELAINRITVGEQRACFTAFIRDITDRITKSRELQQTAQNLQSEQARQTVMMRYLRTTNRAAAKIATLVDPLDIANNVVATLTTEFDATIAGLWLCNAQQRLTLAAESGFGLSPPTSMGAEIDIMMNAYKIGWVARFGRPYVGPIQEDDLQFEHTWVKSEGLKWAAIHPLMARGRLHGVLTILLREEMPLGGSDVIATLATIIAGSLDTASSAKSLNPSLQRP